MSGSSFIYLILCPFLFNSTIKSGIISLISWIYGRFIINFPTPPPYPRQYQSRPVLPFPCEADAY